MVEAETVAPRDVLILARGVRLAADAALTGAVNLSVDASVLTGESQPLERIVGDAVHADTIVLSGEGEAVVTATGLATRRPKAAEDAAASGDAIFRIETRSARRIVLDREPPHWHRAQLRRTADDPYRSVACVRDHSGGAADPHHYGPRPRRVSTVAAELPGQAQAWVAPLGGFDCGCSYRASGQGGQGVAESPSRGAGVPTPLGAESQSGTRRNQAAGGVPGAHPCRGPHRRPIKRASDHLSLIRMRLTSSMACRDFGSVTVRTPFWNEAVTLSASTSAGNRTRRSNCP